VSDRDDKEVLIPEVLPPEDGYRRAPPPPQGPEPRGKPMNPILAGIAIDAIDFITWGPAGLLIGFGAMYWILSDYRMPGWKRFLLSLPRLRSDRDNGRRGDPLPEIDPSQTPSSVWSARVPFRREGSTAW
jgi:hypothetical protein